MARIATCSKCGTQLALQVVPTLRATTFVRVANYALQPNLVDAPRPRDPQAIDGIARRALHEVGQHAGRFGVAKAAFSDVVIMRSNRASISPGIRIVKVVLIVASESPLNVARRSSIIDSIRLTQSRTSLRSLASYISAAYSRQ